MKKPETELTCSVSPSGKENRYMDLMRSALRMTGIEPLSGKEICKSDYIWHHWIEKLHFLFVPKLMAATGKKVVFNVHNKIPHDSRNTGKAKQFTASMAKIAHKIVIHCNESVEVIQGLCGKDPAILEKIVYVPHPNYIGIYGQEKKENKLSNDKLSLCFFGKVKEYKNIELLISAIRELNFEDVELRIIGRCWNVGYFRDLIGDNIHIKTDFRFVDDQEIPEISANCHLFVLPYNLESSLNSGATLLAFSYGRSVLSSLTGTLADIEDKSMFFSYDFNSQEEHKEALKQQLTEIRNRYKGRYNELLTLGNQCREYVRENNSLEQVAGQLELVFADKEKTPRNLSTRLACFSFRSIRPVIKIMLLVKKGIRILQRN
ncbi:glycosyltransferase [Bacteroidales bacterium OttesenSCG-928-J19]|nr:glycosyltransferase [Bacteroidales bacterium OttesenSCG-928-J19]